jgi:rhodanese-related sulfurtransferase
MDESPMPEEKKGRPLHKILTIILIAIILIAAIFYFNFNILSEGNQENLVYTSTYRNIHPQDALELINNTPKNLTIVDIRSCECSWDKNHLPGAIWNINPSSFYKTKNDLLIYDEDGSGSIVFSEKLVNNVYGEIMFLDGGIDSWLALGYPVIS